jgi:hypothetical protein
MYTPYIGDVYMVKAMIKISEQANQILNIVKARNNLKDKSEAIEYIALSYGEEMLEPKLRPEFIEEMRRIKKEKPSDIGDMEAFRKRFRIKKDV